MLLYDIGDEVRATGVFTLDNVPTDPTAVTFTYYLPDGTSGTAAAVHDSTGNYHADFPASQAGLIRWKFAGTGTVVAVVQGSLIVQDPTTDLVTLGQLKAVLDLTETDQDAKLYSAIRDASSAIRAYTGRAFGAAVGGSETRTYQYDRTGWLEIDDASAITGVTLDGLVLTATRDYVLGPDRGYLTPDASRVYEWIELRPGRGLDPEMGFLQGYDSWLLYPTSTAFPNVYSSVQVTGTFGFPSVPGDVQRAALWTAVEFATMPQPFSHATIGTYSVDQTRAVTDAIPPRAKELLAPYRRIQ